MKIILAIALVSAAFSMMPAVSANNCAPEGVVCEGTYGEGDCTNGWAYNYVTFSAVAASGRVHTACMGEPNGYIRDVGACAVTITAHRVCADWFALSYGSHTVCSMSVYASYVGSQGVECIAGGPPGVPAVMP